jgi:hypothetical protein
MRKRLELAGEKFGRLRAISQIGVEKRTGRVLWLCVCDCGKETQSSGPALKAGQKKSCGCLARENSITHGATRHRIITPEFAIWRSMLGRCRNKNCKSWKRYGGRGIEVCERWNEFQNFYDDMGDRPPGLELERIDNDGNYEPGNCRWASHVEQANNRRNNRFLEARGQKMTIAQWSRETGLLQSTIWQRMARGWPASDILATEKFREGSRKHSVL